VSGRVRSRQRGSAAGRAWSRGRAFRRVRGSAAGRARSRSRAFARERGQAAVELVALLPLLVTVALGVLQGLAAGVAAELADHAAENAAIALARGADPAAAARAAVPGWSGGRVEVAVRGRRVGVRIVPPALVPGLGERLAARAVADAGPAS